MVCFDLQITCLHLDVINRHYLILNVEIVCSVCMSDCLSTHVVCGIFGC